MSLYNSKLLITMFFKLLPLVFIFPESRCQLDMNATLPQGLQTQNYSLPICIEITDAVGSSSIRVYFGSASNSSITSTASGLTRISSAPVVQPTQLSVAQLTAQMESPGSLFTKLSAAQNPSTLLPFVSAVTKYLDAVNDTQPGIFLQYLFNIL